ncbi:MAG: LysM peptidoglycan-binding domain-containing protein [Sedimentisphaerales bacterium]|nr:LysM peptidoglycan-binding domain-containing protein [Sedimentisphaerales bacterium]
MTSDAKIGLLLGLVFIFIIAFVINGLPRFRNAVGNSGQAQSIVDPQNESLAIGQRERRAQEVFDWQEQFESEPAQDLQPDVQDNSFVADFGFEQPYDNEYVSAEEPEPPVEVALNYETPDNIRYQMPLTPNASVIENRRFDEPSNLNRNSTPEENIRHTPTERQQPVQTSRPKTYVVKEGDGNLSNIAKKCYGEIEGNRLVNVNRIFEANRNILKSADEIFVGQKLIIPPLPVSRQNSTENRSVFSNQLFERVNSVGGRSDTGRWYVVKEDDSLWKIAAEQLGNGSRYTEISKLNADILADEDDLDPGMRLQLPAR